MNHWEEIRHQFPLLKQQTYLDSAEMGALPDTVTQSFVTYATRLSQEGILMWDDIEQTIATARKLSAQVLNTDTKNIAFVPNTTAGMNIIADYCRQKLPENKRKVLTFTDEYPASTLPWLHHGFSVTAVPCDISMNEFEKLVKESAVCVVSHVEYSTGFRHDLEQIATLCKKYHVFLVINATQSLGAFQIDLSKITPDFLIASTYKWLCSGFGTAILYISDQFLSECTPWAIGPESIKGYNVQQALTSDLTLKTEASVHEGGTLNYITVYSLRAALEQAISIGIPAIQTRILELTTYLRKQLRAANFSIVADRSTKHWSGITTITVENPEKIEKMLLDKGTIVSVRKDGLRIALHYYNTTEDIDTFMSQVTHFLKK